MPVNQCYRVTHMIFYRIYRPVLVIVILFLLSPHSLRAQSYINRGHLTTYEVVFVPGKVYEPGDKNFAYKLHSHFLVSPSRLSSRLAMGVSTEYIFGNDWHLTAGPVFAIHPWRNLIALYSMGVTFRNTEEGKGLEYFFSNHLEFAYEFEIGEYFRIGPSAGFNLSGYDNHISAGLYTGFTF